MKTKTTFTFWKGVNNTEELNEYINLHGDCPESEIFITKCKGDDELIKKKGFIEEIPSYFNDNELNEMPKTLKKALNN